MLIPLVIILFLAAFGAGILPGVVPACAVAAVLSLMILRPPKVAMLKGFWWTGQLALLWVLLTLVPLPRCLVGGRRNAHFDRVAQTFVDYEKQQSLTPADVSAPVDLATVAVTRRLTLNEAGTIRFFLLFAGCWATFWLVGRCSARGRRWLLALLVLSGAGIAAAGLVGQWIIPQGKTLWWLFPVEHGSPIGPFVNKNHFASFCAMLTPAAVCLLVSPRSRTGKSKGHSGHERWSRWASYGARVLFLLAFGLLVSATVLSLSRGGLLALMAGLGVVVLVSLRDHPVVATATALVAVATIFALVFWPSAAVQEEVGTLREASETDSGQSRLRTWRDSAKLWRSYCLTGCGHEAFRTVFPLYKTHRSRKTFTHAENDYVQLLTDGGAIGVAFFLALLWYYVHSTVLWQRSFTSLRAEPKDRHQYSTFTIPSSMLRTAAFGAAAVVACHSLLDFSLRIPLNAFLFAALLGLALPLNRVSPKTSLTTGGKKRSRLRRAMPVVVHWCTCSALLAVMVFYGLLAWQEGGPYDRDTFLVRAPVRELCRALTKAPTYWYAWYEMGRRASERSAGYWHAAQALPEQHTQNDDQSDKPSPTAPGTQVTGKDRDQVDRAEEGQAPEGPGTDVPVQGTSLSRADLLRLSASWQAYALSCLRRSAECNQSNHEAWWQLGQAELAAGNVEGAHLAFDHVVRLRPYLRPKVDELFGGKPPKAASGEEAGDARTRETGSS